MPGNSLKTENLNCLSPSAKSEFKFTGVKGQETFNHLSVKFFSCSHLKDCADGKDYETLCVPLHGAKDVISKFKDQICSTEDQLQEYLSTNLPSIFTTNLQFDPSHQNSNAIPIHSSLKMHELSYLDAAKSRQYSVNLQQN